MKLITLTELLTVKTLNEFPELTDNKKIAKTLYHISIKIEDKGRDLHSRFANK